MTTIPTVAQSNSKMPRLWHSFRVRLLLLLAVLLGLTLFVAYYLNLRSVRSNAHLIVEQEQAIMAGVALGVNSISSGEYLDEMDKEAKQPLLDKQAGRVKNVLVIDGEGNIQDSLQREFAPTTNPDGSRRYVGVKDIDLPPLKSAVDLSEDFGLPEGLSIATQLRPGDPGAFYFPVETTKGRWYIVVVLSSANTLTSLLERQASRSALYTLLLLVATTLVTGLFVWRFTRPIKDLSVAARRVATGNFDVRVPTDRHDEIGSLAAAFNDMTAGLGRAHELESQLHQVEKAAVVGRLAAAIAHEIRNPLNYINLTLDHLRSTFAPVDASKRETFERLADQLKAEVGRINRHITDFLKYSRPSSLELLPLNLSFELADAMRVIECQAAENGIETSLQEAEGTPRVFADQDSLRSAFTNLLLNGLEAMDGEGGSVRITLAAESTDRVRIEVTDTGRGIAREDISKVFEPYYSTKETGTGLGLAIVKKAIDDHGGSISVSSKVGSGTKFTILLPVEPEGKERMTE